VVPAMHETIYRSPVLIENIKKLKQLGVTVIEWGFDLNPLAVQVLSARTNYLIALGKLIKSASDRGRLFQTPGRDDSIALPFLSSLSPGYQYLA